VTTRDEAIRLLEEQHAEVARLFAELEPAAFERRGTIGGGEWSAKDLAAHLGAWEEFSLEVLEAFGRGERPAIEDEFGREGAVDRLNAREERRFLATPSDEVLARFEDLHGRIVGEIGSMSDDGWAAAYPFDPDDATIGDRVGGLLGSAEGRFLHASAHLPDLRAYVEATRR
jgi:Mycothiol maleylpyruvate isomerase N-terminal domain